MSELKGLHTADNHIGYRQYGLNQREEDMASSLENIINLAIKDKYNYLTVSGDLLNSKYPSVETIKLLSRINQKLIDVGIPMLVISGNHDGGFRNSNWTSIFNQTLDNENLFNKGGIYDIDFKRIKINELTIFGCPYVLKDIWLLKQKELPKTDIVLMHQTFENFFKFPSTNSFKVETDIEEKFKLIIVGDIHISELQDINIKRESKKNKLEYKFQLLSPGSTELCSKNEDENKFIWESVFNEGVISVKPIKLKTRKVYRLKIKSIEDLKNLVNDNNIIKEKPILYLEIAIGNSLSILDNIEGINNLSKNTIFRPFYSTEAFIDTKTNLLLENNNYEGETLDVIAKKTLESLNFKFTPSEKDEFLSLVLQGLNPETNFKKQVAYFMDNYMT